MTNDAVFGGLPPRPGGLALFRHCFTVKTVREFSINVNFMFFFNSKADLTQI